MRSVNNRPDALLASHALIAVNYHRAHLDTTGLEGDPTQFSAQASGRICPSLLRRRIELGHHVAKDRVGGSDVIDVMEGIGIGIVPIRPSAARGVRVVPVGLGEVSQ